MPELSCKICGETDHLSVEHNKIIAITDIVLIGAMASYLIVMGIEQRDLSAVIFSGLIYVRCLLVIRELGIIPWRR